MPAKIELTNADNICERYKAGESVDQIGRSLGVCFRPVKRILIENGVQLRKLKEALKSRFLFISPDQRRAMTANANKMARKVMVGILNKRYSLMSIDDRRSITKSANIAARGRTISTGTLLKTSATRELLLDPVFISGLENALAIQLRKAGLLITQQKSIGIYNIDIAIDEPPIAVEIYGGNFHSFGKHLDRHFKRTKFILDQGWPVIIVWVDNRSHPLTIGCCEYITAFTQEFRLNPSLRRQYRVILGNGQTAPICKTYLNTRAIVETFGAGNGI